MISRLKNWVRTLIYGHQPTSVVVEPSGVYVPPHPMNPIVVQPSPSNTSVAPMETPPTTPTVKTKRLKTSRKSQPADQDSGSKPKATRKPKKVDTASIP
jgi:hypothetical protein